MPAGKQQPRRPKKPRAAGRNAAAAASAPARPVSARPAGQRWEEGGHAADAAQKARLLAQMDVTMIQKLAFASAHFQLHDGARILDIGCARGLGSYNFALLNPRLQVVGMDYDAAYIEEARATYKLPNLSFIQGDARKLRLPPGERFDAIFNSSVMHEIYSYSGYSEEAAIASLKAQLRLLKPGGTLLIRDFVRPDDPGAMVYLDLPAGESTGAAPRDLSYPDLLRRYARSANALKPEAERGFYLEDIGPQEGGKWHRFYLPAEWASEFIWRKEYRDRFDPEAEEKYSFWNAADFRRIPETLGARVAYTAPYRNPWIEKHWHKDKYRLFNQNMEEITGPPSNFIAVLHKGPAGEGISLREHRLSDSPPAYLREEHFVNAGTGDRYDLASRPGAVYDVLPYAFNAAGHLVVYAKSGYPRPIVNIHARRMSPDLDGKSWSGHLVEPLAVANREHGLAEAVHNVLQERAGFREEPGLALMPGLTYYTAPGDVNERVESVFARVRDEGYEKKLRGRFSGFSSDGTVRAFEAQDLLRGMQVGMVAEARLEMNIYALFKKLGIAPAPWIGDSFEIPAASVPVAKLADLLGGAPHKPFARVGEGAGYLKTVRSLFVEEARHKGAKRTIALRELEFVVPGGDISTNTAAAVPLVRDAKTGEILIGVRVRDLPAAQEQEGSSRILAAPAFRLPSAVRDLRAARSHVAARAGVAADAVSCLGESYFPSTGIMPNRVFPMVVAGAGADLPGDCRFVRLRELFENAEKLRDANLVVAVMRSVHALGLWEQYAPAPKAAGPSSPAL